MKPVAIFFVGLILSPAFVPAPARAQLIFQRTVMLSPAEVDLLDATSSTHLENARRFLAEKQWDEAIDALRRAMEGDTARYVPVAEATALPEGFERLIPIREHCQWRLAALASEAPEALRVYRSLADPLAEQWLKEAAESRDEQLLVRLVREVLATRFGDEALLRLGDFAMERGEYAAARGWYQRIGHALTQTRDRPAQAPTAGLYPDSDLSPALVRSRLVLASILGGSARRAEGELDIFRRLHPGDEGEIGGRSGPLADLLAAQLAQAQRWPPPRRPEDWPTFAGNPARDGQAAAEIDPPGRAAWSLALPRLTSDRDWIGAGRVRSADDMKGLLSYFPVASGNTLLVRVDARGKSYIAAHDVKSGEKSWQVDAPREPGQPPTVDGDDAPFEVSDAHAGLMRHAGVARYTLTVHGHKLFARLGSPVTAPASRRLDRVLTGSQGYVAGFDLATQGKPLEGFPIRPESSEWSFEGTPLCDGGNLYVAMRRIEQGRCQFFVACFELQTTGAEQPDNNGDRPSGRMRWRTKICSAGTLSGGDAEEISHLLLSLDSGALFLNTNHGVIAAIDAADGVVRWLCKYPRVPFRSGDPDRGDEPFFRDLTPCLVAGDLVICAPADCERLFALERTSGRLAWTTPPGTAADVVHLLGANNDYLLASGNYLYWLDLRTGQVVTQFPQRQTAGPQEAAPSPRGLGRGILSSDRVYFPTRESIFVFRQTPRAVGAGWTPDGVAEIPLIPRGATGGNLVIASGMLFIAAGDRLYAFDAGQ